MFEVIAASYAPFWIVAAVTIVLVIAVAKFLD